MANVNKVISVKVQGNALLVDDAELDKGHHLIAWQLDGPVEGTGGVFTLDWGSPPPPPDIFSGFESLRQDWAVMDDKNMDDKNNKNRKGKWPYTLTLTTSSNTYSTTLSPMGNPNIKNN